MSRPRRGGRASRRRSSWALAAVAVGATGAVLAIAFLARHRSEARLEPEAQLAQSPMPLPTQAEEASDDRLEKLLKAADSTQASLATLDGAAHALLVRERFEEAEPLVSRALALAPQDAEAAIHGAVLQGVAGDSVAARSALQRLSSGAAGWEASMFEAGFALNDGDDAAALAALQRFRAAAPPGEVRPEVESLIAELKGRLASSPVHKGAQKQP